MSIQYYPNGIGGYPPGDFLDTCKPLQTSGNVWYVSFLTGIDATGTAGQNREKPLKTLAQAVTNAAAGDIIVFLPGHTQTLTVQQLIGKQLTLIGEGVVAGKPAVSFVGNMPADSLFRITAAGSELRNIYFPQHTQANAQEKVVVLGADVQIIGCYFDCGATDQAATLAFSGSRLLIERSTFISTATVSSAQPAMAIQLQFGPGAAGLTLKDVVVSAGTVGFSNYAAIDLTGGTATQVRMEGLSLLLGSDVAMGNLATGRVNVQLSTGGSRVSWG